MKHKILLFLGLTLFISCKHQPEETRQVLDLTGTWQFAPDPDNTGMQMAWYNTDFADSITLPGTTDLGRKGYRNTDTTTMHLNRLYRYEGVAWYRKKIRVPESFKDKHITLMLERTKSSMVWVDDQLVGDSKLLQTPQCFDVSPYLQPGEHTLTIRIDNSLRNTPYGNVHIYSDDTQTNWNGIIGKLQLEAASKTHITDIQVFPDTEKKKISVRLNVQKAPDVKEVDIELYVQQQYGKKTKNLKRRRYTVPVTDSAVHLEYELGSQMQWWDDYRQPLYKLTAVISSGQLKDSKTVPFGMRTFGVRGTQFTINGRVVFLRGKNDACVFPLTGHPPMDTEGWTRIFKIARSYGINHYRFHSWCPPEAAFDAADSVGIYLQVETPFWGGLDTDSVADMLKAEGLAMLKWYANHPSFVMFSHGNEIWGGHDLVERNIKAFKDYDNRPLYTMGSNNNIGYVAPRACSDYFVAARTPYAHDTILTHTRLTHAYADSRDGGILNSTTPNTQVTFDYAVSQIDMPVVSHEIGQYQVFPDYREIEKYTGVLRAWNLEVFRNRLDKAGMMDQHSDFQKASGAWSALCYKAEMEAAFRTKGFAGFQLLDLQDFPGQGTALVGILDAFMDDKGVISRDAWLQSCNDVVVLAQFPRYCYTADEEFRADITVANYSHEVIAGAVNWELKKPGGEVIQSGKTDVKQILQGQLTNAGDIAVSLSALKDAGKLTLRVWLGEGGYANEYPLWVFPVPGTIKTGDVVIADKPGEDVLAALQAGKKVLLFPLPGMVKENSVGGLFPPEFWNYGMFRNISVSNNKPVSPGTLGILTNPGHPLFGSFPTDFHTNWQWFSIIRSARPLILDKTPAGYRPLVQVIDNLERNHKLGLIFEFKAGEGKLLVCMAPLHEMGDKPEAVQLYRSMIGYMQSDAFSPAFTIDKELLKQLFH